MRYVIAGKKETFNKYSKKNNYKITLDFFKPDDNAFYITSIKSIKMITEDDIIVLLAGWFAKKWAKDFIKQIKILYPTIDFEYHDGQAGESERRNDLQSESILSRFDILDL